MVEEVVVVVVVEEEEVVARHPLPHLRRTGMCARVCGCMTREHGAITSACPAGTVVRSPRHVSAPTHPTQPTMEGAQRLLRRIVCVTRIAHVCVPFVCPSPPPFCPIQGTPIQWRWWQRQCS